MSLKVLEITFVIEMLVFALWRLRQDVGRREASRINDDSQPWLSRRASGSRTSQFPSHWKVPMPVL